MLKQEQPAIGFFVHGLLGMHATSGTRLLQGAEATPDTSDSDANRDESSGLQADTIALHGYDNVARPGLLPSTSEGIEGCGP
jgi:hypothetical protein